MKNTVSCGNKRQCYVWWNKCTNSGILISQRKHCKKHARHLWTQQQIGSEQGLSSVSVSKRQILLFADVGKNTQGDFWVSMWVMGGGGGGTEAYRLQLSHCQHSCHSRHQILCGLLCHSQLRHHSLHYGTVRWAPHHRHKPAWWELQCLKSERDSETPRTC